VAGESGLRREGCIGQEPISEGSKDDLEFDEPPFR